MKKIGFALCFALALALGACTESRIETTGTSPSSRAEREIDLAMEEDRRTDTVSTAPSKTAASRRLGPSPVFIALGTAAIASFAVIMVIMLRVPAPDPEDATYYRDDRTGYCFSYHPGPGGFEDRIFIAVCDGIPATRLQPMPENVKADLQYARSARTGMCYVQLSEEDPHMPVSCERSAALLR